MMRALLIISISFKFLFAQETIIKQSTISSGAINVSGQNTNLMGTVGQTFSGKLNSDNTYLSTGIWGSISYAVLHIDEQLPIEFSISKAYPNPFNPTVHIDIEIPEKTIVKIKIYDLLGKLVFSYNQDFSNSGKYSFQWHGMNNYNQPISSGIYMVSIEHQTKIYNQKITYLK